LPKQELSLFIMLFAFLTNIHL